MAETKVDSDIHQLLASLGLNHYPKPGASQVARPSASFPELGLSDPSTRMGFGLRRELVIPSSPPPRQRLRFLCKSERVHATPLPFRNDNGDLAGYWVLRNQNASTGDSMSVLHPSHVQRCIRPNDIESDEHWSAAVQSAHAQSDVLAMDIDQLVAMTESKLDTDAPPEKLTARERAKVKARDMRTRELLSPLPPAMLNQRLLHEQKLAAADNELFRGSLLCVVQMPHLHPPRFPNSPLKGLCANALVERANHNLSCRDSWCLVTAGTAALTHVIVSGLNLQARGRVQAEVACSIDTGAVIDQLAVCKAGSEPLALSCLLLPRVLIVVRTASRLLHVLDLRADVELQDEPRGGDQEEQQPAAVNHVVDDDEDENMSALTSVGDEVICDQPAPDTAGHERTVAWKLTVMDTVALPRRALHVSSHPVLPSCFACVLTNGDLWVWYGKNMLTKVAFAEYRKAASVALFVPQDVTDVGDSPATSATNNTGVDTASNSGSDSGSESDYNDSGSGSGSDQSGVAGNKAGGSGSTSKTPLLGAGSLTWIKCAFTANHPRSVLVVFRRGVVRVPVDDPGSAKHIRLPFDALSNRICAFAASETHPFHFVVCTSSTVYLLDSRYPAEAVLQWNHKGAPPTSVVFEPMGVVVSSHVDAKGTPTLLRYIDGSCLSKCLRSAGVMDIAAQAAQSAIVVDCARPLPGLPFVSHFPPSASLPLRQACGALRGVALVPTSVCQMPCWQSAWTHRGGAWWGTREAAACHCWTPEEREIMARWRPTSDTTEHGSASDSGSGSDSGSDSEDSGSKGSSGRPDSKESPAAFLGDDAYDDSGSESDSDESTDEQPNVGLDDEFVGATHGGGTVSYALLEVTDAGDVFCWPLGYKLGGDAHLAPALPLPTEQLVIPRNCCLETPSWLNESCLHKAAIWDLHTLFFHQLVTVSRARYDCDPNVHWEPPSRAQSLENSTSAMSIQQWTTFVSHIKEPTPLLTVLEWLDDALRQGPYSPAVFVHNQPLAQRMKTRELKRSRLCELLDKLCTENHRQTEGRLCFARLQVHHMPHDADVEFLTPITWDSHGRDLPLTPPCACGINLEEPIDQPIMPCSIMCSGLFRCMVYPASREAVPAWLSVEVKETQPTPHWPGLGSQTTLTPTPTPRLPSATPQSQSVLDLSLQVAALQRGISTGDIEMEEDQTVPGDDILSALATELSSLLDD